MPFAFENYYHLQILPSKFLDTDLFSYSFAQALFVNEVFTANTIFCYNLLMDNLHYWPNLLRREGSYICNLLPFEYRIWHLMGTIVIDKV